MVVDKSMDGSTQYQVRTPDGVQACSIEQLRQMAARGELLPDTAVRPPLDEHWQNAAELVELSEFFEDTRVGGEVADPWSIWDAMPHTPDPPPQAAPEPADESDDNDSAEELETVIIPRQEILPSPSKNNLAVLSPPPRIDVTSPEASEPEDLPPPCLLYTSPSPRDRTRSRMPSSA